MGHLGHAKPHTSFPRKSQQSGKFMHHSAKYLFGLDFETSSFAKLKTVQKHKNNKMPTKILDVEGSNIASSLKTSKTVFFYTSSSRENTLNDME